MSLGISISSECAELYREMKRGKKYRWITFKLSEDEKEIIVDKTGERESSYSMFQASLPSQEPRWAIFNFEYKTERGPNQKMLFLLWVPDVQRKTLKEAARIKTLAVMYSAPLKATFPDVSLVQVNDPGDLEWSLLLEKAAKFERDPVDINWRPSYDFIDSSHSMVSRNNDLIIISYQLSP